MTNKTKRRLIIGILSVALIISAYWLVQFFTRQSRWDR